MHVYYDKDADLAIIKAKKVAIKNIFVFFKYAVFKMNCYLKLGRIIRALSGGEFSRVTLHLRQ